MISAGILILLALGTAAVMAVISSRNDRLLAGYLDLGNKYLVENDYEQAIVEFEKAIAIDPKQPAAYEGMARAWFSLGDTQRAVGIIEEGIEQTGARELKELLAQMEEEAALQSAAAAEETQEVRTVEGTGAEGAEAEGGEAESPEEEVPPLSPEELDFGEAVSQVITGPDYGIGIVSDRKAVILLKDPALISSYLTNRADSDKDVLEHEWAVFFGNEGSRFNVSITTWAYAPGEEEQMSVAAMQSNLWVEEGGGSWSNILDITPVIDENWIRWTVVIPDGYDISFMDITESHSEIYHIGME